MTIEQINNKIKKDYKRHRTLEQTSKNEEYKLAHSMVADYLEELIEEVQRKCN